MKKQKNVGVWLRSCFFFLGKDRKTEHYTHFCMPLEPVFTRDCGSGVHFMDEPVNGLDPQGMAEIREIIIRLNKEKGITFIISSHILGELSKIATTYGIIDKGELKKQISQTELTEDLEEYFFGLTGGVSNE